MLLYLFDMVVLSLVDSAGAGDDGDQDNGTDAAGTSIMFSVFIKGRLLIARFCWQEGFKDSLSADLPIKGSRLALHALPMCSNCH